MSLGRNASRWFTLSVLCLGSGLLAVAGCVIITTPLTVDAGADVSTTTGATVVFSASASGGTGQYEYRWSPAAGLSNPTISNPTYIASTVGDHTFTVTLMDSSGQATTDSITIHVTSTRQPLMASAGPDLRSPVDLPVTLQGSATGGSGTYTFAWSPTTGLSSANVAQPSFTPSAAGPSTFTLTVTDTEGTIASDTVEVTAYQATTLTGLKWAVDSSVGYQLIATFSQPLDKTSAETPTNYRDHATNTAASSAVLGADNQTVTFTFTSLTLASGSTFDIGLGAGLKDTSGNPVLTVTNRGADANSSDTTAPVILSRKWGVDSSSDYQIIVQFSEAMDRLTTQDVSAYRLNGFVTPQSATVSGDGQRVTLVFTGVALSPSATLDVAFAGSIHDVNGRPLAISSAQSVAANSADIIAPTVVFARHSAQFASTGYQISVQFSEAISAVDAQTVTGYQINGVPASTASLGGDGRTVTLVFLTPIARTDQLIVGTGGVIKDINGVALLQTTITIAPNTGDTVGPVIISRFWSENGTSYQVLVTFSESMDKATATTTSNYTISTFSGSANPNVASLDNTGKMVTLTFAVTGSGLRRTDTLTVSNTVEDINGRANTSTAAAPISASPPDINGPTVTSRTWQANSSVYQVLLVFNEVLDRETALNGTNYVMNGDSGTDQRSPSSVTLDTTGRFVTLVFANTTGGFRLTDTLTVLANVLDINGKANGSTGAVAVTANSSDVTGPTISSIAWGANGASYQVLVTFSEPLDKTSATTTSNYTISTFSGTANPSLASLDGTGKIVTLTFDVAGLRPAETLTVSSSVKDINGQANTSTAAASISDNSTDATSPTVVSRVWAANATSYQVLVTFSEVLDRDTAIDANNYQMNGNAGGDLRNPSSVSLDTTGRVVTLGFATTTAGFRLTDTLTIQAAVLDINGNSNASTTAVVVAANSSDTTRPAISSGSVVDATHVDVTFSEVMDKVSIEAATYTVGGGVNVTGAALRPDGRTVRLTTDADPTAQTVTVPVTVKDINGQVPAAPLTFP